MTSRFSTFKDLHQSPELFILPNVWNAKSAELFQKNGFSAIGTSSAAVANSLGYEDGEAMPFIEYLFIIKRIVSSVQIPVSVDMEMGYGATDEEIYGNLSKLIELGVVGINIEDSAISKSVRTLKDSKSFAKTIENLKSKLVSKGLSLFINLRCDTFILNVENKKEESMKRIKTYESAGADGIFLPCIAHENDIAAIVSNTKLPLNVMCIPGLPGFESLNKLGVKRVSMGPFLFNKTYDQINQLCQSIKESNDFSPILT